MRKYSSRVSLNTCWANFGVAFARMNLMLKSVYAGLRTATASLISYKVVITDKSIIDASNVWNLIAFRQQWKTHFTNCIDLHLKILTIFAKSFFKLFEETSVFTLDIFVVIDFIWILDFQRNDRWTIDYVVYHYFNTWMLSEDVKLLLRISNSSLIRVSKIQLVDLWEFISYKNNNIFINNILIILTL